MSELSCPKCQVIPITNKVATGHGIAVSCCNFICSIIFLIWYNFITIYGTIEIDRCTGCHGIWFDAMKAQTFKEIKGLDAG